MNQRDLAELWTLTQAAMDKLRNELPDADFSVFEDMAIENAIYHALIKSRNG